jgi:hypothetical protein
MISELSGDLFLGGKTLSFVETGIIQLDFGLVETTYRKNITCSQRSTMITKKNMHNNIGTARSINIDIAALASNTECWDVESCPSVLRILKDSGKRPQKQVLQNNMIFLKFPLCTGEFHII